MLTVHRNLWIAQLTHLSLKFTLHNLGKFRYATHKCSRLILITQFVISFHKKDNYKGIKVILFMTSCL